LAVAAIPVHHLVPARVDVTVVVVAEEVVNPALLIRPTAALVVIPQVVVEEVVTPDLLIRPTALVAIQVAVVEEVVILVVFQMEVVWAVEPVVILIILIRTAGIRQKDVALLPLPLPLPLTLPLPPPLPPPTVTAPAIKVVRNTHLQQNCAIQT
jgi:hypothetical protein